MSEELSQYVRSARQGGLADDRIRENLRGAGWNAADIEVALAAGQGPSASAAVGSATQPMPERNPHETYLYIFSLISLFFLLTAAGSVLFQLINKWVGDPGEDLWSSAFGHQYRDSVIRAGVASIIVLLPFYLIHWMKLGVEVARQSIRHASKVRARWLHVGIFFGVLVLMSDLTALATSIMNGELSARPVWKIVTVFVLAGLAVGYFVFLLREDRRVAAGHSAAPSDSVLFRVAFAGFLVISMGVVSALGLANAASPVTASQVRRDERRLTDLRQVQLALELYADDNQQTYPDTITRLTAKGASGRAYTSKLPKDPKTGADYEYRKTAAGGYELCANFETDKSQEEGSYYGYRPDDIYRHGKGRACMTGQPPRTLPQGGYPYAPAPIQ